MSHSSSSVHHIPWGKDAQDLGLDPGSLERREWTLDGRGSLSLVRRHPRRRGDRVCQPHFIRDIGCAYLVTALALLWFAAAPEQARPAVLFGGVFLVLHAFVHFWDTAAGRESPHRLMAEIPTVILPAFLVLWLGWPPRSTSRKEL